MAADGKLTLETETPGSVPYFNWDAPVTNAEVRQALRHGSEDDRAFWVARILSEARYADVWKYLSLPRDVLPLWDRVRNRLGRRRAFWEFLIGEWRRAGLIE